MDGSPRGFASEGLEHPQVICLQQDYFWLLGPVCAAQRISRGLQSGSEIAVTCNRYAGATNLCFT